MACLVLFVAADYYFHDCLVSLTPFLPTSLLHVVVVDDERTEHQQHRKKNRDRVIVSGLMHESMIQLIGKQGIVESVLLTSPSMNPIFSLLMSTMTDDDKRNAIWYNVFLETNKYIEFPSTYLRRMFCVDHGRHDNNILAMLRANPVANDDDTAAAAANISSKSAKAPTTKRKKKATVAKGTRTPVAASKVAKKKKPVEKKAPKNTTARKKKPPPKQQPTSDDAKMTALMEEANISEPLSTYKAEETDIAHALLLFSNSTNANSSASANASSSLKKTSPPHAATGEVAVTMDIVPPSTPYATGTITKKYFKEYRAWYKGTIIEYNSTTYLYKVGYEDGDHEELEHHEINTEPLPSHPLYNLGVKFERFLLRKSTEEELGWMIGTIKSQFYYIPPRRSNTRSNNRWRYRVEYEDNDSEDLDEFEITETIESSQHKRKSDGNYGNDVTGNNNPGRWTRKEHMKLAKGLARYGMDDKKKLAALVTTRTARSVGAYITRHHKELVEDAKKYKNNSKADDDQVMEDDGKVSDGEESVSSSSKSVPSSDDDSDSDDESSMDDEERERRKRIPHWTGKEHNQFINGSRNYGYGNLKEIDEANCIPTRTYDQLLRYFRWYITDLTKNKRMVLNWGLKGNINGLPGKEWVWSDDEDNEDDDEDDDDDGDADDEKEEEREENLAEEDAKANSDVDGNDQDQDARQVQEQEDVEEKKVKAKVTHRKSGKWTKEEYRKLAKGLAKYGKDYKKLHPLIPTRTAGSIGLYLNRHYEELKEEGEKYGDDDSDDDADEMNKEEDGHEDDAASDGGEIGEELEQEDDDNNDDEGEQVIKCGNCTKWTGKERKKIAMGIARYGVDRKKLAALIPTRTPGSVFTYISRYHDKLLKEGEQYKAEDEDEDKMKDDDENDNDGNKAYLRTGRWTSEEHEKCAESIIAHG
jgi:hypothetical protein